MTKQLRTAVAALALTVTLGGAAIAQDVEPASLPADDNSVEVVFAGATYTLFADEPVQACVMTREDSVVAEASVEYRLFVREVDGSFSSVGVYPSPAIGAMSGALAGDCMSLEGFDADAS